MKALLLAGDCDKSELLTLVGSECQEQKKRECISGRLMGLVANRENARSSGWLNTPCIRPNTERERSAMINLSFLRMAGL